MSITESQITIIVTFYNEHDMHSTARSWYATQQRESTKKACETSIILSQSTKLIQQTQQNDPTHVRTHISQNTINNSKIQEIKAIIMKNLEKIRKPIPFLEDWSWDDEEKWRFFEKEHGEFVREMNGQDNEHSKMFEGKRKSFKNCH